MTIITYFPNPGHQMPDEARAKVARIFGQTITEATTERGAVTIVEQALYNHLDIERQLNEKTPSTVYQKNERVKLAAQIAKTTHKLRQLLENSLTYTLVSEDDEPFVEATLPGAIAAVVEPDLQLSVDHAGRLRGNTILIERCFTEHTEVLGQLWILEQATDKWSRFYTSARVGRPREPMHSLVNELNRAWRDILSEDRDAYERWDRKPSAPNSPLCQMLPEALKALGHEVPTSIPQIVQKILKAAEADQKACDTEADRWAEAIEHKFGKNALPFGSD